MIRHDNQIRDCIQWLAGHHDTTAQRLLDGLKTDLELWVAGEYAILALLGSSSL
jgi:hypothetical protein